MLAGPPSQDGTATPTVEVSTRAVDLVLGSNVIDMLGLLTLDWQRLWQWQSAPETFQLADFRCLEASGIKVFHPAVETGGRDRHAAALQWIHGWNALVGGRVCYLERVDDARGLRRSGPQRLGVVLGFQHSEHFRTADDVRLFHQLGQRVSQLTYNARNRIGSGCYERTDRGLTEFGASVVRAMNGTGMAIDVSHCGERTSREAIVHSTAPVLVTHANCRALTPRQPRCKSNELIRRLARSGGVMGVTAVPVFVSPRRLPTLDDLLDHFDHVASIAGAEHVGLGSDVDVTAMDPQTGRTRTFYAIAGLTPSTRVFQIADGLLARGWTPGDVKLVLGDNFLRVLTAIWASGSGGTEDANRPRDPFCPSPNPVPPPEIREVG